MKIDNHYLPQLYLKNWENKDKEIWKYRVLVSNDNVPIWKQVSAKNTAFQKYLYALVLKGEESDEIEQWFDKEFESPAKEPIDKAINGKRMSPSDWEKLIKYFALQDVRTPKRYIEHSERMNKNLPKILNEVLKDSIKALSNTEYVPKENVIQDLDKLPSKISIESRQDGNKRIKLESVSGRATWLWGIKHLMNSSYKILNTHRWTILRPHIETEIITSDNPTIRLNYSNENHYSFKGGWNFNGTELILPLSPNALLYTKVGEKPPKRDTELNRKATKDLKKIIAENSFRYIFSTFKDADIPLLKPRTVNSELYKQEMKEWNKWHKEHGEIESEFLK